MTADCFLDTNVLVYSVSSAPSELQKKEKAVELIRTKNFGISAQVLQEFFVTVTRKLKEPISHDAALRMIRVLADFPLVNTTSDLVLRGATLSQRYQLSYWDGAIIAAAEHLSAGTLYSEDLSDRQRFGSITVINPFAAP